jgi:hypothetical protein
MGINRFESIHANMIPTIPDLKYISNKLHELWSDCIEQTKVCTIDEAVIGYQPSSKTKDKACEEGAPIPTVYMPRKPHPNGLLSHLLCCSIPNPIVANETIPFVLDIIPHLEMHDYSAKEVVEAFMDRWLLEAKPHLVGDAAYGSFETLTKIVNWGGNGTFSFNSNKENFLWETLAFNVPPQNSRIAENESFVASVHVINANGKRVTQQVVSTAYKSAKLHPTSTPNQSSTSNMPLFSAEELRSHKVTELKVICRKYNVKSAGLKEAIIERLVQRSNLMNKDLNKVKQTEAAMKSHWIADKNNDVSLHTFYKDHFNYVDLIDRRWNSIEAHHHIKHWETKMLFKLLKFNVINFWSYRASYQYMDFLDFRNQLAINLM